RKHWEVENGLHHVKDRSWLEDHQYSNNRNRGGILGTMRNLSLQGSDYDFAGILAYIRRFTID
ncbi:MAG: hypothetical protein ACI9YB_001855, partial [Halioglobus sp.]